MGLDDYHTLNIWDWKRGKVMASARGHGDRLFDVQFSPVPNPNITLVTCGVKHIKFWSLCGNTLSGKKGIFGKKGTGIFCVLALTVIFVVCVCVCV